MKNDAGSTGKPPGLYRMQNTALIEQGFAESIHLAMLSDTIDSTTTTVSLHGKGVPMSTERFCGTAKGTHIVGGRVNVTRHHLVIFFFFIFQLWTTGHRRANVIRHDLSKTGFFFFFFSFSKHGQPSSLRRVSIVLDT